MNNSLNFEEEVSHAKPDTLLREREAKLVRMIEAIAALGQSLEWSTLRTELFDGALETIEKRMRDEADKAELNTPELYRLQGERKWAKRYADLPKLSDQYRAELAHIRKQLLKPL
jgi:hypothetical protein